jgi:hypothetical protein
VTWCSRPRGDREAAVDAQLRVPHPALPLGCRVVAGHGRWRDAAPRHLGDSEYEDVGGVAVGVGPFGD